MVLLRLGLKGWNILERLTISCACLSIEWAIQIYDQISIIRNYSKLKLRHTFSLGLGLKVVKIAWNVAKVHVHACLSNGHPNRWSSSILRTWSKVKLHHVVLLGFGLKEPKIALNIVKVDMHSYLPNSHLNLWSNFIFEILVESESPSCGLVRVWFKGVKNNSEHHESCHALLYSKCASKSMIKF